jgi:hypothetical protein
MHMNQVMTELGGRLSSTTSTFDAFLGPGGDHSYFSDVEHDQARRALSAIHSSADELKALERRINIMEKSCNESAKAVSNNYHYLSSNSDFFCSSSFVWRWRIIGSLAQAMISISGLAVYLHALLK